MRIAALMTLALLTTAPAAAQRFGGGFRPAPTVYRAPTPAPAYRAPAPVSRPAPVTRPAPTQTRTTRTETTVTHATAPAAKPLASTPRTRNPTLTGRDARGTVKARTSDRSTSDRPASPVAARRPRSIRMNGSTYAWTAPAIMPYWWMSAMNRPYDSGSYDAFIERCLRTPRRERSKECVRALRERGLAG